jgi:hypothetical protein
MTTNLQQKSNTELGLDDGTIRLETASVTVSYNTEEWYKDDSFIAVGMNDQAGQDLVCNCPQQYAEIGATVFNYTVMAPAERTQPMGKNFKYPVMFRRAKNG